MGYTMTSNGLLRCARMVACGVVLSSATGLSAQDAAKQEMNLPSGHHLLLPVPGGAQRVNSLPISTAASPDGRWVVTLNAGYGTLESDYEQSLAVVNVKTGALRDFPDSRTLIKAKQSFFSGLAFYGDGT